MRSFLKFLCFAIVIAVSTFVIYFLINENNTYVRNEVTTEQTEKDETISPQKNPSVPDSKSIEKQREDIKLRDILVLSGDNNLEAVSLTTIRKSNIDNIIERNIDENGVNMFKGENIPLEAYGPIVRDTANSRISSRVILSQDYILGSVQVSGTMIYLMPDDESQDRIQYHFAENGKLVAFVREIVSDNELKTIVYFDENEIPFEQYFNTKDKVKTFEENYDDIYNRAKYAYNKYFNEEEN